MTSDQTRHTATAWPVPGEPTLWSVTWLPGRALTRDQAVTAMTIAEVAATHEFAPVGDAPGDVDKVWLFIDGWAHELGITGPAAVARASMPPEDHAASPAPCGLCQLRAERGIEQPPGGCTCQAAR